MDRMVERRNSQFAGCRGGELLQRLGECSHVEARSISIMAVDLPRGIVDQRTERRRAEPIARRGGDV
jgi:hypothetical protein